MTIRDFYCGQKFSFLSVNLDRRTISSCCSALPERVDISWLRQNPGRLFNTPKLQQERAEMLNNIAVSSCETCWQPERQGSLSRRLKHQSQDLHAKDIESSPTVLDIVVGTSCNMSCVYCCKQYSTAWIHDINRNGPYFDEDRFSLDELDKVIVRLTHNQLQQDKSFKLLLNETFQYQTAKLIHISGGEPFLYNNLHKLIDRLPTEAKVEIYTGLGVDHKRFRRQLDKINPSATVVVSAENLNEYYEFNRFGNSYDNFLKNLQLLFDTGRRVKFNSVISNLTIFGLLDFYNKFSEYEIKFEFCSAPEFLGVNVLDSVSKQSLIDCIGQADIVIGDQLITNLEIECSLKQKSDFRSYIKQYCLRRGLDLNIFPSSMTDWLRN